MPSDSTFCPGPTRTGLLACAILAVVLLGSAGVLASADLGGERVAADPTEQDEPRVTITSPEDNATYAHADIVRIDLEFEGAETAVLTLENVTNAGPDPVTFHVTVEDANGSGTATVYFNPYQAFDGPVTDCDPDVEFEECDDIFIPDNHRNHGFFTHPEDDGSALIEADRPAAVRYAPETTERGGGSAGEYVLPANVSYELSVSAGAELDRRRRQFPDDVSELRLRGAAECTVTALAAPRRGQNAIDPGELDAFADVQALLEQEVVTDFGTDPIVSSDEYVVLDFRARGVDGVFHEIARRNGPAYEASFLDGRAVITDAFVDAVASRERGMRTVTMPISVGYPHSTDLDPAETIERVVSHIDGSGHRDRFVIFLRIDGTTVAGSEERLRSGSELETGVSIFRSRPYENRFVAPIVDPDNGDREERPVSLSCGTEEVQWTFYDPNESSISAGFTSPASAQEVGEDVTFNGLRSDGIIESYEWAFGDGASAENKSVEHAYDEPGVYTVELTVSGPAGNATASETVIVVEDADDPLPAANVSVDEPQAGPEVGTELAFEAATDAPAELIEGYRWEFDDGTTAVGPTASHSYDEPGEYVVNVTVIGVAGENTTRRTVVVEEASAPSVSIEGEAEDGQITLRANSSGGAIDRYGWDLGDGTSLNGDTVTHTYDEPGEYSVELLVTGPGGTDTATVTVRAEEGAEAADGDGADLRVTIPEGASGGTDADDGLGHGFGIVAAIAALAGAAALFLRRR